MAEVKEVKVGRGGVWRGKRCSVLGVDKAAGTLVVRFDEERVGQVYASGVPRVPVVEPSRAPDAVVPAGEFVADVEAEVESAPKAGKLTGAQEETASGMRGDLEKLTGRDVGRG